MNRRQFIKATLNCTVAVGLNDVTHRAIAQTVPVTPVVPSPEIDEFKMAQRQLLKKYAVSAKSRFIKLQKPAPRKTFARRGSGSFAVGILTLLSTALFGGLAALGVYLLG